MEYREQIGLKYWWGFNWLWRGGPTYSEGIPTRMMAKIAWKMGYPQQKLLKDCINLFEAIGRDTPKAEIKQWIGRMVSGHHSPLFMTSKELEKYYDFIDDEDDLSWRESHTSLMWTTWIEGHDNGWMLVDAKGRTLPNAPTNYSPPSEEFKADSDDEDEDDEY